jgi:hypothetical protein
MAPMSTTSDLEVALDYATRTSCEDSETQNMVVKLKIDSFMQRGADVSAFSCFPMEKEYLFPPLCFLEPTSFPEKVQIGNHNHLLLEVVPYWPSS